MPYTSPGTGAARDKLLGVLEKLIPNGTSKQPLPVPQPIEEGLQRYRAPTAAERRNLVAALLLWPLPDPKAIGEGLKRFRRALAALLKAKDHPLAHLLLIDAGIMEPGQELLPYRTAQARTVASNTLAVRVARLYPRGGDGLGSGDPYHDEELHALYYELGKAVGKAHGITLSKAKLREAIRHVDEMEDETGLLRGLAVDGKNNPS